MEKLTEQRAQLPPFRKPQSLPSAEQDREVLPADQPVLVVWSQHPAVTLEVLLVAVIFTG